MKLTSLRIAAAVASVSTVLLLGIGAPAALGAPAPAPTVPVSLVDPAAGVQLDIHKYLGTPTGQPNNGTEQTVSRPPLKGVVFDVFQVYYDSARSNPINLTTNAGWTSAAAVTGYTPTQAQITAGSFVIGGTTYYLGTSVPVTTGTDGTASFNKPAGAGLYLVNENLAASGPTVQQCPGGVCTDVPTSQVTPSNPFFVTLPMTHPVNLNTWMYQVHVYPKNQQDTATKSVADQGTQTAEGSDRGGDHTIMFTINTSITDGMTVAQMQKYVITDTLDSRLSSPVVKVYTSADGTGGGLSPALTPVTDYVLSGNVVITLTDAGLAKLVAANNANAAATVVTTIEASVDTEGNGTISNTAYVIPNQAWADAHPGQPGTPTNPTQTKYGDLRIIKAAVPAVTDPSVMAGAEFAVYLDPTPATGCTAADVTTSVSNPVIGTAVTDATAKATVKGLQTSDFYNGQTQTDLQQYCLVETKAPVGYNLNPQAIQFTILQGSATAEIPAFEELTVNNQKTNLGNELPITGGGGVAALSVGGLLLVGGGLAYYFVSTRRRHNV